MNRSFLNIVGFDILLKAQASGRMPHVSNIEKFKPSSENIVKCQRWLTSKGVTCHSTDFGLACRAPVELFEVLFSTQVKRSKSGQGVPYWHCSPPPKAPREIEEHVDCISIPPPPEFF